MQQVLPWVTSVGVHAGIIVFAFILLASGALQTLIPKTVQQQLIVPTTTLATDGNIGGVPNVGNLDDVTSENRSLSPVADSQDYRNLGEGDNAADLLTPAASSDSGSSITGITGMGEMTDALGGGGGDGARLFGEGGGGSGFMGIDIGRPGEGGNNRRIIFICDASGSMEGEAKWLLVRKLKEAIEPLVVDQSFNVLFFQNNDFTAAFRDEMKPSTRRFKEEAYQYLDNDLIMSGQTNPLPAIEAAFAMEPDLIFFLTDGRFDQLQGYEAVVDAFRRLNPNKSVPVNTIQFINRDETAEAVLKRIAWESVAEDTPPALRPKYVYVSKDDL